VDQEGIVLPNDAVALQRAAVTARYMAAQSVLEGRLVLDHRIEVVDKSGEIIGVVHFRDVVNVQS
jgi:predicted RNA-binding protein with PUA domain